jgi:hypothetical protein
MTNDKIAVSVRRIACAISRTKPPLLANSFLFSGWQYVQRGGRFTLACALGRITQYQAAQGKPQLLSSIPALKEDAQMDPVTLILAFGASRLISWVAREIATEVGGPTAGKVAGVAASVLTMATVGSLGSDGGAALSDINA